MWHVISSDQRCQELFNILSFMNEANGIVTLLVNEPLRNLANFEDWCTTQKFPFSTMDDFRAIHKESLIRQIRSGLPVSYAPLFVQNLHKRTKDQLILYLHQFKIFEQFVSVFLDDKDATLHNRFFEIDARRNPFMTREIKEGEVLEVKTFIENKLNSIDPPAGIFAAIQNNAALRQKNSFAELLSKFRFIARLED
jgi:hypothetical protein